MSDAVWIALISAPTLLAALWLVGKLFAAYPVSRVEFEAQAKELTTVREAFAAHRRDSRDRLEQFEHDAEEIKKRHDALLKYFEASKAEVESNASKLSQLIADASRRSMRA